MPAKSVTRTWDSYVKEAHRPAFKLQVSADKTITVGQPTGDQAIRAQRLGADGGDAEQQIRIICGDAADDILELVRDGPAVAMGELITDIMQHFGVDDDEGEADSRT